jgi:DNA-binding response OmpR family regulator
MSPTATILIVDDNPVGRNTLEMLLLSPDYQFDFAGDGPTALAKAAELRPDLILLDVMMPGMDGFELCRRLRADASLAEIPVVMVTALDDRDSRLAGIEAGADDFIVKPFDQAELLARVRTITRLNRYRRLLAARTRFEWVIEQASDGYLLLDNNDEVLYLNPQARLYLGLAEDAGEPITEKFLALAQKLYHCEPAANWLNWPQPPALGRDAPFYLIHPETNTTPPSWLQVTLLDQSVGLETQRLVQLRDVTVQMSLQRDIRNFQSALSHKLRTPLTHITSGLELMVEEESPLSMVEIMHLSKASLEAAHRLQGEIEDILRYMNTSTMAQLETSCALSELQQIVSKISSELKLATVTISVLDEAANVHLKLSRQALECILWEILENAKKFHPRQSPTLEIKINQTNGHFINLKITDDGLTLAPEQLIQAWTPYYQGEKYFTGQTAGMGLGLSTVAVLVWGVGGTCRLYNHNSGPGVVVEVSIPVGQGLTSAGETRGTEENISP